MAHSKLYRSFIILQEDERGHSVSKDKPLSGYAKIEVKNNVCKIAFYAQNLKKEYSQCRMMLICNKKDSKFLVDLGTMNITPQGKAESSLEYDAHNIGNTEIDFEKIVGAAICKEVGGKNNFLMCGFLNGEQPTTNWKEYKKVSAARNVNDGKKQYIEKKVECVCVDKTKEEGTTGTNQNMQEMNTNMGTTGMNQNTNMNMGSTGMSPNTNMNTGSTGMNPNTNTNTGSTGMNQNTNMNMGSTGMNPNTNMNMGSTGMNPNTNMNMGSTGMNQNTNMNMGTTGMNPNTNMNMGNTGMNQNANMNMGTTNMNLDGMADLNNDNYATPPNQRKYRDENEISEKLDIDLDLESVDAALTNKVELNEPQNKFDEYEKDLQQKFEELRYRNAVGDINDDYDFELRGSIGEFFTSIVDGLEPLRVTNEIKKCKWYKVKVKNFDEMCNISNYNKYTTLYYPMINYYPYISKKGHFLVGLKCDNKGRVKYIIYGVPGSKDKQSQPYGGKTGFVTFVPERAGSNEGHWLMFYDFKNSLVVVPMK